MENYITIVLRSVAAFFLALLLCRFMGRKLISRLNIFDFVTAVTVGSLAAAVSVDIETRVGFAALALIVWAVLTFAMDLVVTKSLPMRKIIDGEPIVVIQNGKLLENNMRRIPLNLDELMQQLRVKKVFDPSEVEFAVMEPDGQLSVQLKTQYQPVTPNILNVPTQYQGMITALVKDGRILEQNLTQNHLNREWLLETLKKRGIHKVSDVFYAALDTQGNLFVDLRDDDLEYVQDVEDVPAGENGLLPK